METRLTIGNSVKILTGPYKGNTGIIYDIGGHLPYPFKVRLDYDGEEVTCPYQESEIIKNDSEVAEQTRNSS